MADASDVLHIDNYSLGYRLFYQLKKFSMGSSEFVISGNVRFKPMETSDTATSHQWIKNRQEVYEGSSRHLFKGLLSGRSAIGNEGFESYRDNTGLRGYHQVGRFSEEILEEKYLTYSTALTWPMTRAIPGAIQDSISTAAGSALFTQI